jgi:hypothetical protein
VIEGKREFKQEDLYIITIEKEKLNIENSQAETFSQGLGRLQKQSRQQSGSLIPGVHFSSGGNFNRMRLSYKSYLK